MHHSFNDNNAHVKTHWLNFIKNTKHSRLLYSNLLSVDEDSLLEGNLYKELLADKEFRKHLAENYKDNYGAKIADEDIKKFFLAELAKIDTSSTNAQSELSDMVKLSGIFDIEIPSQSKGVDAEVVKKEVEIAIKDNRNDNADNKVKDNNAVVSNEHSATTGTTHVDNNVKVNDNDNINDS